MKPFAYTQIYKQHLNLREPQPPGLFNSRFERVNCK